MSAPSDPTPNKAKGLSFLIYLNHLLSSWGDRMWDFAVGLYLVILYPESLLVTAVLGFTICLSVIVFGSHLGNWIDKSQRLRVATGAIICQNSFVIFGTILLGLNIVYQQEIQLFWTNGYLQHLLFAAIIFCAVIANLASITSDIVIEKDWIVVFTSGNEKSLATMNAILRTIDLSTHILAPLILGQIITYGSQLSGVIFIGAWNLISALVEYNLLRAIYKAIPALAQKSGNTYDNSPSTFRAKVRESWKGWRMYFRHSIHFAGISFALLFMTVMGFDNITTGYIYSQGGSESLIGIITGTGAILGILGSVTYPYLRDNIGKYSTGNIGLSLNVLFLLFCVGSIFGPGSPFQPVSILHPFEGSDPEAIAPESLSISDLWNQKLNVYYFVFGIILARFGLWIADLNINQILQENVEESRRGVINGVQNSLNQLADLLKFFLVIVFPSPSAFGYLIFATWMFSLFSWISFIIFSITDGSVSRSSSSDSLNDNEEQYLLRKRTKSYTEVNDFEQSPRDALQ